jgi:hypothetical protein
MNEGVPTYILRQTVARKVDPRTEKHQQTLVDSARRNLCLQHDEQEYPMIGSRTGRELRCRAGHLVGVGHCRREKHRADSADWSGQVYILQQQADYRWIRWYRETGRKSDSRCPVCGEEVPGQGDWAFVAALAKTRATGVGSSDLATCHLRFDGRSREKRQPVDGGGKSKCRSTMIVAPSLECLLSGRIMEIVLLLLAC